MHTDVNEIKSAKSTDARPHAHPPYSTAHTTTSMGGGAQWQGWRAAAAEVAAAGIGGAGGVGGDGDGGRAATAATTVAGDEVAGR